MTSYIPGSRKERQKLTISGNRYELYVQWSGPNPSKWSTWALKNGKTGFPTEEILGESEAKKTVHEWAYRDSGDNHHSCVSCPPWEPLDS